MLTACRTKRFGPPAALPGLGSMAVLLSSPPSCLLCGHRRAGTTAKNALRRIVQYDVMYVKEKYSTMGYIAHAVCNWLRH